jgi:hypothetical protein
MDDALTKSLGNQRIIPQPLSSALQEGGYDYTFLATDTPWPASPCSRKGPVSTASASASAIAPSPDSAS